MTIPTIPASPSRPSTLKEAPERVRSITQAAAKMIVSPKLGCCMRSRAMSAVQIPDKGTTGRLASCSFSESIQAIETM